MAASVLHALRCRTFPGSARRGELVFASCEHERNWTSRAALIFRTCEICTSPGGNGGGGVRNRSLRSYTRCDRENGSGWDAIQSNGKSDATPRATMHVADHVRFSCARFHGGGVAGRGCAGLQKTNRCRAKPKSRAHHWCLEARTAERLCLRRRHQSDGGNQLVRQAVQAVRNLVI